MPSSGKLQYQIIFRNLILQIEIYLFMWNLSIYAVRLLFAYLFCKVIYLCFYDNITIVIIDAIYVHLFYLDCLETDIYV